MADLLVEVPRYAQIADQLELRQAGQNGHGHDDRRRRPMGYGVLEGGFLASHHHLAASRGVDRHHPDAKARGFAGALRHGRGDVVILEVEEDPAGFPADMMDRLRSVGREELMADLESSDDVVEAVHQVVGLLERLDVQRDEDAIPRAARGRRDGPRSLLFRPALTGRKRSGRVMRLLFHRRVISMIEELTT